MAAISGYWDFVCNPARWAVDRFLLSGPRESTWGVDRRQIHGFRPGQLAVLRVGRDQRTREQRAGRPPLEPGIYAVCEVLSEAFPRHGPDDGFWYEQAKPEGWPTVRIRYPRTFLDRRPLTIERMRHGGPWIDRRILDGWQGSSFPLPAGDFHQVLELLGEDAEALADSATSIPIDWRQLAEQERRSSEAVPEIKEALSRRAERSPLGGLLQAASFDHLVGAQVLAVNIVGAEGRLVSPQAQVAQPSPDVYPPVPPIGRARPDGGSLSHVAAARATKRHGRTTFREPMSRAAMERRWARRPSSRRVLRCYPARPRSPARWSRLPLTAAA